MQRLTTFCVALLGLKKLRSNRRNLAGLEEVMSEKSLPNLLPEKGQQPPDPEAEAIQEAALEALQPDPTLSAMEPSYETKDEPLLLPVDTADPHAKEIPTKAELETTVSELRESLNESRVRENSLHQKIADLQSDLQEQKILLQKLLTELESTNKIKDELEQAKKVILQLLDNSPKTTQEADTPKKENKGLMPQKLALKKLPNQPIPPNSPSGELFEQNVGWFD